MMWRMSLRGKVIGILILCHNLFSVYKRLQQYFVLSLLDLFQSLYDFFAEIRNYRIFFLAFSGTSFRVTEEDSLSEKAVWPTLFLLNVSTALRGTHNCIFICIAFNVRALFNSNFNFDKQYFLIS